MLNKTQRVFRGMAIQKMCRPDFELMRKDEDLSMLIVEVKSLFK